MRKTAARFGISKSTVHKDLTERLPRINRSVASQVRDVLDVNKAERHIRGGEATKKKYKELIGYYNKNMIETYITELLNWGRMMLCGMMKYKHQTLEKMFLLKI